MAKDDDNMIALNHMASANFKAKKPKTKNVFKYEEGCFNPKEDLPQWVRHFNKGQGGFQNPSKEY